MTKLKDFTLTCITLILATVIAQFLTLFTDNLVNPSIIYILFIIIISRFTTGYIWGMVASVFSMFAINFLFTFPLFKFDFTLYGYPLTFICLLLISLFTSTITAHAKEQTRLANEREMMMMELNDFNRSLLISKDSDQTIDILLAYIYTRFQADCFIYFNYENRLKKECTYEHMSFDDKYLLRNINHVINENSIFKDAPYTYFPIDKYGVLGIKSIDIDISISYINLILQQASLNLEKQLLLDNHYQLSIETEKEKMRANLLRAISHDLRTPLTNMIGASATYIEAKAHLDENQRDHLVESIHEDSNWLLHMVENLLSVTRISQEEAKVKKSEEAIEEIVSESITRIKKRYPDSLIKVSVPDEYLLVPMDATLIEQVIINLTENAIKYSKSKEPIELLVTKDDQYVQFNIIDYGVGFDTEDMDSIFDSYRSNDISKGMGIGLSICKTIILAHDGVIKATKNKQGTTFTFSLPIGGITNEN